MITKWGLPYHAVFGVSAADQNDPTLRAYLPRAAENEPLARAEKRLNNYARWCRRLELRLAALERRGRG